MQVSAPHPARTSHDRLSHPRYIGLKDLAGQIFIGQFVVQPVAYLPTFYLFKEAVMGEHRTYSAMAGSAMVWSEFGFVFWFVCGDAYVDGQSIVCQYIIWGYGSSCGYSYVGNSQ